MSLFGYYIFLLHNTILIMKSICVISFAICVTLSSSGQSLKIEPRIIDGDTASDGQFPYQVSLQTKFSRRHFCAASIISNRFLLTAGHCANRESWDFIAVAGTVHRFAGSIHEIAKIIRHECFDVTIIRNDIALLVTENAIVFTWNIQPIALPTRNDYGNTLVILSGWGRRKVSKFPSLPFNRMLNCNMQVEPIVPNISL